MLKMAPVIQPGISGLWGGGEPSLLGAGYGCLSLEGTHQDVISRLRLEAVEVMITR